MLQPINTFALNTTRIVLVVTENPAQDASATVELVSSVTLAEDNVVFIGTDVESFSTVYPEITATYSALVDNVTSVSSSKSSMFVTTKPKYLETKVALYSTLFSDSSRTVSLKSELPVVSTLERGAWDLSSLDVACSSGFTATSEQTSAASFWKHNTPALRIGNPSALDEFMGRIKILFDPYI
jgi:hypothetical protein